MWEQGKYASGSSSGLALIPKGGVVGIPILFRGRRGRALRALPGSVLPFDVDLPILYSLRPSAVNPGDTRLRCIKLGGFDLLAHMYCSGTGCFRQCLSPRIYPSIVWMVPINSSLVNGLAIRPNRSIP